MIIKKDELIKTIKEIIKETLEEDPILLDSPRKAIVREERNRRRKRGK